MNEYQETLLEHNLVAEILKNTVLELRSSRKMLSRDMASIPLRLECKRLNSEVLALSPMYNEICDKAIDGLEKKYGAKLDFLRVPEEPKQNGKQQ